MAGRRSLGVETISISHDDPLRDLFEACKHGDVSRVSLRYTYTGILCTYFAFLAAFVPDLIHATHPYTKQHSDSLPGDNLSLPGEAVGDTAERERPGHGWQEELSSSLCCRSSAA